MSEVRMERCVICGQEFPWDDMYLSPEGEFICEECHDANISVCPDCNCEYWNDDLTPVHIDDGAISNVCQSCLHSYSQCEDCEDYFEDVTWRGNHCYCNCCIADHTVQLVDEDEPITCYHQHHNEEPVFFKLDNEGNEPYFGVELEVDAVSSYCNDNDEIALDIASIMPNDFIYFENDGSLDEGFENITQPATLAYHNSIKSQYKKMFKRIVHSGLRSHQTRTCGMHVHFNRNFFDSENEELYVARLLYLVENFWDKMVIFSRRRPSELDRWCKHYDSDVNHIAKLWKDGDISCHEDRYHAVNLMNDNTIEFRIFRGTLKWNTYIATLQFCYNMIMTAKDKNVNEIQTMKFEELINTPELKTYWVEACARKHINLDPETLEVVVEAEEVVSGDVVEEDNIEE